MTIPIVPKLLRAHLSDLAENDARIDGRLIYHDFSGAILNSYM